MLKLGISLVPITPIFYQSPILSVQSTLVYSASLSRVGIWCSYLERRLEHHHFGRRRYPRLAVHLHWDLALQVDLDVSPLLGTMLDVFECSVFSENE